MHVVRGGHEGVSSKWRREERNVHETGTFGLFLVCGILDQVGAVQVSLEVLNPT